MTDVIYVVPSIAGYMTWFMAGLLTLAMWGTIYRVLRGLFK